MTKEQTLKMLQGRIDTASSLLNECFELIYKAGFNDGFDAAAKLCEHDGYTVGEIRNLKK